jgi:hypothetical protein
VFDLGFMVGIQGPLAAILQHAPNIAKMEPLRVDGFKVMDRQPEQHWITPKPWAWVRDYPGCLGGVDVLPGIVFDLLSGSPKRSPERQRWSSERVWLMVYDTQAEAAIALDKVVGKLVLERAGIAF